MNPGKLFRALLRGNFATEIRHDGRELTLTGDPVTSAVMRDIREVLSDAAAGPGWIRLHRDGRITMSGWDKRLEQRIRNVLASR